MAKRTYIKHLVECNCILPQFKNLPDPLFHKFVVFSEIDENNEFIPTIVTCNNCGSAHRVYEVSRTELLKNESTKNIISKDDMKLFFSEKLQVILEKYECDLPVWQEIQFIIENEMWGKEVILLRENEESKDKTILSLTTLLIAGNTLFKINKRQKEMAKND
jgi:hypothetical protein